MKNKIFITILALIGTVCFAFGFSACGERNESIYYLYDNGEYIKSEYIALGDGSWSDSHGMEGSYEINDGFIYLYIKSFGRQTLYKKGGTGSDKLVLEGLSGVTTYCKEGTALPHSFGKWQVAVEPTCTRSGVKMRSCACGEIERLPIFALGHDTTGDNIDFLPATCKRAGRISGLCDRCGENVDEELPVDPNAHYIERGKSTDVCSGCGVALASSLKFQIFSKYAVLSEIYGTSVTVPTMYAGKPVTQIANIAFAKCENLTSLTIPESITYIDLDGDEFAKCPFFTAITVAEGNGVYSSEDGTLFNKSKTVLIRVPTGKKSVRIPDGVTRIDDNAFNYCDKLESIEVDENNSVYLSRDEIVYKYNDEGLPRITIVPLAIKGSASIPEGVTSVNGEAFRGRAELTGISIPDSVTSIGERAFKDCTSLQSVTIGNKVTAIGGYAFRNCKSLAEISIPDGVISVGNGAFAGCTNLKNVAIGKGVTAIGSGAFAGANLESVTFENSVGWEAIESSYSYGRTEISLSTPEQNASLLSAYKYHEWIRKQ